MSVKTILPYIIVILAASSTALAQNKPATALELSPGEHYQAVFLYDTLTGELWPENGIDILPHHSASIHWENKNDFEAYFGTGNKKFTIHFKVEQHTIMKIFQEYEWLDTYYCKFFSVEAIE